MNLEELKIRQTAEIMKWADEVDSIITPDSIAPEHIKDFPEAMDVSSRLKIICKAKVKELKDKILAIEDVTLDSIEQQEYVFKINGGGQPLMKKKFPTVEKQKRELRRRLAFNDDWRNLKEEVVTWELMYSSWVSHHDKLRRELRLLEHEYSTSGTSMFDRKEKVFHPNRR